MFNSSSGQELAGNGIVGIGRIDQRQKAGDTATAYFLATSDVTARFHHRDHFLALKLGRNTASSPIAGRKAQTL